ncbi:AAA family ATPase [Brevundimonas pondensis]|uniref:Pilus assembly protein CpaE n=1 Tax=Brevundimonas pondensis TaxID=2774189 RepID=A0ABX7SKK0_9CAUL|nr:pilus assembly protein CpaE [Brevundimonas pondensis]QTC87884.1 pilus assembly protein CpaE [Brevundimonas pondensis]
MTQSFATREPDDLDGFEMDDEFLNLAAAETAGADAVPAYPTGPDAEAAFNPVGRLVDAAESAAVTAILPAVATPAPVAPGAVAEPLSHSLEVAGLPVAAAATVEVSIPRIAVHVFAERQDTLAAAERAGQDRRMARATTQIRIGGVSAAVAAYQGEPTPPLIIVECLKDPQTLLWEIDQLAEVCDAGTKVVVIGATNDILLFRELMRRGVSEYLVAPVQPLQLISAIGGLFADPAQPFVGRSIAFVGARGGAGASAVAHNTAYAMSERIGVNTVIVDYDLPFGTAGLDFNQDPLGGVADALSQPDRLDATLLDRMMVRCTDKLSLFAAPATLDADWDIQPDAFEEVTSRIRSTAPFVVLDLPHLWSGWMRRTLISADEVVIVATPDLASLRNAKNMIDLVKQARPNDAPPRLVLNQVGVPGRPEIPAKDFGAALGVHPSLIIPFDAKVFGSAANNGQMIVEAGAKSKAAEAFQTLAQIVSRRELPVFAAPRGKAEGASSKGGSLFAGLLKKKR